LGVGFLALLSHNPAILVLPDMDGWKIMKKRHLNIFNVKDTPLMLNKELENHPMEKGASFWFHPHFQVQPLRTIVDSNQCGLLPFHLGGSSFSDTSLQSLRCAAKRSMRKQRRLLSELTFGVCFYEQIQK